MSNNFVLDASALIAFLADEEGTTKVEDILNKAKKGICVIYMNKLNLLEVYYGVYREDGKAKAEEVLNKVSKLPLFVNDMMSDELFREAGRLKASYKISLADSIAIAETKIREAQLLTSDHHEFDYLDKKGEARFYWIR